MRFRSASLLVALSLVLFVSTAAAQSWRGMGRLAGKVTDEQGNPIPNATVKLELPGSGGTEVKTNKKGEWTIGGIARGDWNVDFLAETYEPRRITVSVAELTRVPPVEITLKRDVNATVDAEMAKAGELLNQKKYAEARAVYEGILTKYPEAHRVEAYIARTYYGEKNYDEAIKHLKVAVEADPTDMENRLRLGNILMDQGRFEEGRQMIASVNDGAIKDPAILVNVGISLLNQNKAAEALPLFEKAITLFPSDGSAYYYRALVRLQQGNTEGTRADLNTFLKLSPDAPEADAARKALEQLK